MALVGDSYLKYMQAGAIWEAMIRAGNPARTRAKYDPLKRLCLEKKSTCHHVFDPVLKAAYLESGKVQCTARCLSLIIIDRKSGSASF